MWSVGGWGSAETHKDYVEPSCFSLGIMLVCHCRQGSDFMDGGALPKIWCTCYGKLHMKLVKDSEKLWAKLLPRGDSSGAGGTGFCPIPTRWGRRSMTTWVSCNSIWPYANHLNVNLPALFSTLQISCRVHLWPILTQNPTGKGILAVGTIQSHHNILF